MSALRRSDGRRLRPHGPCARLGGVGQRRSTDETLEQGPQTVCGECGGKAAGQGEHPLASHAPDTARVFLRVPGATGCAESALALSVIHPRQEPYALMSARTDPCGGCRVTGIPTAKVVGGQVPGARCQVVCMWWVVCCMWGKASPHLQTTTCHIPHTDLGHAEY